MPPDKPKRLDKKKLVMKKVEGQNPEPPVSASVVPPIHLSDSVLFVVVVVVVGCCDCDVRFYRCGMWVLVAVCVHGVACCMLMNLNG